MCSGVCEKVASDLGLGVDVRRVLRFPPPVNATGLSRAGRNKGRKSEEIANFNVSNHCWKEVHMT